MPAGTPNFPKLFPQPPANAFSTNYSTVDCQDLMMNLTQTSAFRECRPFSLLVQDSNLYITVSLFDFLCVPFGLSLLLSTSLHPLARSFPFAVHILICDCGFEPTACVWVGGLEGQDRRTDGQIGSEGNEQATTAPLLRPEGGVLQEF